jgi:PKD domain-containing protein
MRRLALALGALLVLAPAAGAKKFFGGVVPDLVTGGRVHAQPLAHAANLPYGGGPVLHSNRTHVIFWQPSGSGLGFDGGYTALVDRFLADVAADSHRPTNPYGLSGQYTDSSGPAAYQSTFAGSILDTDALPRNGCTEPLLLLGGPGWSRCLSDQEIEDEINHVVSSHHLSHTGHDIYFVLTPNGLGSCEFTGPSDCALGGETYSGYCGYHSSTSDGLPYAVIPYNALNGHCQSTNPRPNGSTADPTISPISHEHNETVTDPFGNAWIDGSFAEDGDLCITTYGPALGGSGAGEYNEVIHGHRYFIQEEWSNADGSCQPRARPDRLSFSAPAQIRAEAWGQFIAHGSAPQARLVSYRWWFGDGRTGHGSHVHHRFKRAGRYRVVARGTDSWDNWVLSAGTVVVDRR